MDIGLGIVIAIVVIAVLVYRIKFSMGLAEAARKGRPATRGERILFIVALLALIGLGVWRGLS